MVVRWEISASKFPSSYSKFFPKVSEMFPLIHCTDGNIYSTSHSSTCQFYSL